MTPIQRKKAERLIDALLEIAETQKFCFGSACITERGAAALLRELVTGLQCKPQGEPAAWHSTSAPLEYLTRCADGTTFLNVAPMPGHAVEWSYAHPPQCEPLTDEQIVQALADARSVK